MLHCGSLAKQPNKHTTYKSLVGEEKKNVSLHLMHFARKKNSRKKNEKLILIIGYRLTC